MVIPSRSSIDTLGTQLGFHLGFQVAYRPPCVRDFLNESGDLNVGQLEPDRCLAPQARGGLSLTALRATRSEDAEQEQQ